METGKRMRMVFGLGALLLVQAGCASKTVVVLPPQQKFIYALKPDEITEEIRKAKLALKQAKEAPLRGVLLLDLAYFCSHSKNPEPDYVAAVRYLEEYGKIIPAQPLIDHALYVRDLIREIQVWKSAFDAQTVEKSRLAGAKRNSESEIATLRKRNEELSRTIEELKAIDLQSEEQRKSIE